MQNPFSTIQTTHPTVTAPSTGMTSTASNVRPMYKLDLKVIEAKNILREEKISDPLVEVGIRGPMHPIFKSNFVSQTVNPTWDQVFVLSAHNPEEFLVMRIVDARTGELMGETEIALGPYLNQGPKDFWVSLFLHRHQRKGFLFHKRKETDEAWIRTPGDVHVQISWAPIDEAQLQSQQPVQQPSSIQQPLSGQPQQQGIPAQTAQTSQPFQQSNIAQQGSNIPPQVTQPFQQSNIPQSTLGKLEQPIVSQPLGQPAIQSSSLGQQSVLPPPQKPKLAFSSTPSTAFTSSHPNL